VNVIKNPNMQATYQTTKARYLALAAALTLLLNSGVAQTVAPKAPDSTKPGEEEAAIVLSPFVVDATKDNGYLASSTLAGSRINTDLKDVSQSITIVTKAFMTDIGAVGVNDILSYTAGTESSRDYTETHTEFGKPTDSVANNSTSGVRIRGLAKPDITRDYFYSIGTWAGFDSYNLDEVTIVRGPNSVLAGIGSPAGIVNYSPQQALTNKSSNEASFRFGSWGDKRATLNSNIMVIKNRLAFRVAAVHSDKGFEQKPAWNKDTRYYLAMTYKPWSKTTIQASYEHMKVDAHNPNTLTPEDDVSIWKAVGKPIYDSTSAAPVSSLLTQNTGSVTPVVMFNKDGTRGSAYDFNSLGYTYYYTWPSNPGIFIPQRMHDDSLINLHKVNLNPSLQNLGMKTFSVTLDQEIVHGLYANLAYVKETANNSFLDLFRSEYSVYSIDVNKYLPGGAANPHFMETYMQFRGLDNKRLDDATNRVVRGALTYDLDLTKHNKWLGRYQVTGFAEKRKTESIVTQYNNTSSTAAESISFRYYMGGSDTVKATTVPGYPAVQTGVSYNGGTLNSFYQQKSVTSTLEELTTKAIVLQSYWWDNRIVGLFGIRNDKDDKFGVSAAETTKNYGVVVHPLKWLSVHYNRSENFTPNAGAMDLMGNATPSPTGTTKDYGFSVSLLDNKLNAKINWFDTRSKNAGADNITFPLAQWEIPYMERSVMPELAAKAGITYKPLISSSLNQGPTWEAASWGRSVGDPRLANAYTSDTVSKGIELELTYNVSKNWRVQANLTKQEAKQTNIAPGLTAFIQNRLAYWQSIPALWTVGTADGWGTQYTGQQYWQRANAKPNEQVYIGYKSADGQPTTQVAKWHFSGITNYEFSEGALKGYSIGGGARYIEGQTIGNPAFINSSGTVTGLDLAHPYKNSGYVAFDMWMGYKMKLSDKYELSFQLNIRDLQSGGSYRPIIANSSGQHAAFRIVEPRSYYLTTTLKF
jgi:outer membrane receptor protein involved in Fe transport